MEEVNADEHGCYVAVTVLKNDADRVDRLLMARGFVRVAFPQISQTARGAYEAANQRLLDIEREQFKQEELLRDYAEQLDDVEILCDIEQTTVNVCLQKRKLAATRNCAVLQGWIPATMETRVTKALSNFECACEIAEPEADEEPPVLLKNNKWAANFEWVIGMYSYPKYGTYDPSFIMAIFYFLIFGMMFADVGYGLLLAVSSCSIQERVCAE